MTQSDADGKINFTVDGHILIMEIDRPTKLNGFTPQMCVQLAEGYTRLENDDDLRVAFVEEVDQVTGDIVDVLDVPRNLRVAGPEFLQAVVQVRQVGQRQRRVELGDAVHRHTATTDTCPIWN